MHDMLGNFKTAIIYKLYELFSFKLIDFMDIIHN